MKNEKVAMLYSCRFRVFVVVEYRYSLRNKIMSLKFELNDNHCTRKTVLSVMLPAFISQVIL